MTTADQLRSRLAEMDVRKDKFVRLETNNVKHTIHFTQAGFKVHTYSMYNPQYSGYFTSPSVSKVVEYLLAAHLPEAGYVYQNIFGGRITAVGTFNSAGFGDDESMTVQPVVAYMTNTNDPYVMPIDKFLSVMRFVCTPSKPTATETFTVVMEDSKDFQDLILEHNYAVGHDNVWRKEDKNG